MASEQWFYDTESGQAVQGRTVGWENRMGPYDSRAEAESALERANARNKQWEDDEDQND